MKKVKWLIKFLIPIFVLLIFAFVAIFVGTKFISPFSFFDGTLSKTDFTILTKLRLPRVLCCILCGLLLGGTGAVFQGFFRNPLADSGVIGISSGATLGAVVGGLLPVGLGSALDVAGSAMNVGNTISGSASTLWSGIISPVTLFAFAGALVSGFCVFSISKIFKESSSITLLLCGTALGTFFSAVASVIVMTKQRDLHSFFAWSMGSFNAKGWNDFFVFVIPSVVSLILLQLSSRHLDVLVCGESSAKAFGLNYYFIRNWILISGALATACAVCLGGIISFVGLIGPHIVRRIYGPRHKVLIFESMIAGAVLLIVSDIICRTVIAPAEIPVGIITSLIGVPFFIFVILKKNGETR